MRKLSRNSEAWYAVCPYCETPIQLKSLMKSNETSPSPYGSHTGVQVADWWFDEAAVQACPYRKPLSETGASLREASPLDERIVAIAVNDFDHVVTVLREVYGVSFSQARAEEILDGWFTAKGYRYFRAHLRNIPWVIGFFGPSMNLFGQHILAGSNVDKAIRSHMPNVQFNAANQLEASSKYYKIALDLFGHVITADDGTETMRLRVLDATKTVVPESARWILDNNFTLEFQRFEYLRKDSIRRGRRSQALRVAARAIAAKHGFKVN